jgi:hypothetical protein
MSTNLKHALFSVWARAIVDYPSPFQLFLQVTLKYIGIWQMGAISAVFHCALSQNSAGFIRPCWAQ